MSHQPKNTKVLLLAGGWNYEEKNSLNSGVIWEGILKNMGYTVLMHNPRPGLEELKTIIYENDFDIAFHSLYGPFFEGGELQTFLDELKMKYTHAGTKAAYIQQNKPICKQVVAKAGVPVIEGAVCKFLDICDTHPMQPPYVIKPTDEGSSVGVNIIYEGDGPIGTMKEKWEFGDECLLEKYIAGLEISVGVFRGKALGVAEVVLDSNDKFFSWDAKYNKRTKHAIPARIPQIAIEKAMKFAEISHDAVGCRTISRSDFLYESESEKLYFLELNSHPTISEKSIAWDLIKNKGGISIEDVAFQLIDDGLNA